MSNKILWVNPSFLDYRIPLYSELNKIFNNNFFLIYSKNRVPERCHRKIRSVINDNALFIENEKRLHIGKKTDFANSGVSLTYPKGLYKKIKQVKPDLIIAEGFFQFTPWAVWYSILHRIPLLIAYERTSHTERNCPFWRRWYRRFIGLFVNGYIANGIETKEYLMSQGVKAENIFTGGMCADSIGLANKVANMSEEAIRKTKNDILKKETRGLLYIFVGRIIPLKGVKQLLEAWNVYSSTHQNDNLLIVGDGPLKSELESIYKDNKSIIFTGGIDYSQIYKYYAISDVFIIPTLEDNWSLVVPEAMACGLPIACSIYNGCHPELVRKDENGITFDPLNKESIITALNYFHDVDLASFGERSKEIEHLFNPENTALNIQKAINKYL